MKINTGRGRGAFVVPLAIAALAVAAACSSTAAGGAAATAAQAAAVATTAPVVGSGTYGGGADAAPPMTPAASTAATIYEVKTATDAKAGTFLVGEDGRTLYIFTKDSPGKSVCGGDCATSWPPFTLGAGESAKAGSGATGAIATITRSDGGTQVTYDGAPLYYFAADTKAGDVTGQGMGGVWFVATP